MYPYLSIRSSLFIIFWAKFLHKLIKTLYWGIIFPDYMHFTMLVNVRRYFEAAIAGIPIFKVFSNYEKLTAKPTFSGYCFVNEKP